MNLNSLPSCEAQTKMFFILILSDILEFLILPLATLSPGFGENYFLLSVVSDLVAVVLACFLCFTGGSPCCVNLCVPFKSLNSWKEGLLKEPHSCPGRGPDCRQGRKVTLHGGYAAWQADTSTIRHGGEFLWIFNSQGWDNLTLDFN